LAFSHNSRYLASGSDDHSVRVVEAASGQEVARLSYEGSDLALEFAADDSELTSLARGRFNDVAFVRTDLLSAEKLIDSVCGRLTRNLTRGEWQQYLPSERYRKTCANLPEDGEAGRRP
jgi:WD40 repeat protein